MAHTTKTCKPKKEKRSILHRTQKWPLRLSSEQEQLLYRISDGLREYYNLALSWQEEQYKAYKKAKEVDQKQKDIKGFLTAFDCYTRYKDVQRPADAKANMFRATIPTNWVLETFRQVEGAYKSFFELVKKGDGDARTPREVLPERFQVIPGALSASLSLQDGMIQLAPRAFDGSLRFPVASHQKKELACATRFAKCTIARSKSDLRQPGRLTISLAYEIAQPEEVRFQPRQAVFVALGVNSLAVVSHRGECVIDLRRPDTHWKQAADRVFGRSKKLLCKKQLIKGSQKHRQQASARRTSFDRMSKQQLLDRREIVARKLLAWSEAKPMTKQERRFHRRRERLPNDAMKTVSGGQGVHFVITELPVRSKEGKLADANKPERGGRDGLNWGAQNTGSIAYLVSWLTEKVKEHGGSVRRVALNDSGLTPDTIALSEGEQQIAIARQLRDVFLTNPDSAQVL